VGFGVFSVKQQTPWNLEFADDLWERECQPTSLLTDTPLSRASPLPQCYGVDSGSVSNVLNVSTSGRKLIRCHAAHSGVVKQIHGSSRSTTPRGAFRLWPFRIIAMPSPDATNPNAVKGAVACIRISGGEAGFLLAGRYTLSLANPAVAAVIPVAFWQAMREAKLVSERAPLPLIGA
jgi:hypothetical protein